MERTSGARLGAAVMILGLIGLEAAVAQQPLFESLEPLDLRIEAEFGRLLSEREGRFAARIVSSEAPGDTLSLEIAPRGKSRLDRGFCDFPGLMLFFETDAGGTPFEEQEALPAVTHCNNRDSYEQLMLLEYLAYRTYNVVADLSLRVRLANIEYFDSERDEMRAERLGFFVEHWDVLAARNGWERLTLPQVPPQEYEADARTVFEVFQYLIGNTDWSYSRSAPDEDYCCHNVVPIGAAAGPVFPLPYDFDHAGLVDAPYAEPAPSLPIRTVRERLFRGICGPVEPFNAALRLFENREPEIRGLFENAGYLSERNRERALQYVDEFFEIIADPGKVQSEILSKCRTP